MEESLRYKVKALNSQAYAAAMDLLKQEAEVVLVNPERNTIVATKLDELSADKLRKMEVTVTEEVQFHLD